MQTHWITQSNHNSLLIIALGWGSSPEVLGNQLLPQGYDIVVIYDYKTLDNSVLDLSLYTDIDLLAWSFGVWASEQLFSGVNFNSAIALFGTPYPIHKSYGIDPRVFAITLKAVENDGVVQFVTRMCGRHLRDYLKCHSTRDLLDIQEELRYLGARSTMSYTPKIKWSKFISTTKDLIVPYKAVEKYCVDNNMQYFELDNTPHYPFYDTNFICTIRSL